MISQANNSALRGAYSSTLGESKMTKEATKTEKTSSVEQTKVEQLKELISSGAYKVDLQALAEKMAQDLL
jgi:flagellar biosynthesis anti-sigma factor FlgM